jgi:phage terminase small subunit
MSEKTLTNKQAAFVREYLKDSNGSQAAIRAGYSPTRADAIAYENLRKPVIAKVLAEAQAAIAKKTETEAEWVRRRLKEEADDFSEFASHSARIRALELVGKINGIFEKDNEQQAPKVFAKIELVGVRPKTEPGKA